MFFGSSFPSGFWEITYLHGQDPPVIVSRTRQEGCSHRFHPANQRHPSQCGLWIPLSVGWHRKCSFFFRATVPFIALLSSDFMSEWHYHVTHGPHHNGPPPIVSINKNKARVLYKTVAHFWPHCRHTLLSVCFCTAKITSPAVVK